MTKRTCIFCGCPATSKEHVWPMWILQIIGERRPIRQKLMRGPEVTFRGDFKIKCVCKTCNNGWMSELEGASKRIIEPLIRSMNTDIEPNDHEPMARWITKMAMVLEGTKPQDAQRFFDLETCKLVMEGRGLPANVFIWIGRSSESGYFSNAASFEYTSNETGRVGLGSVTTMVIGHLVAQILVIKHPSAAANQVINFPVRASNWELSLVQLWPSAGDILTWPPPHSFHNNGGSLSLSELKYRWNPNDDGSSEPRL